ncbi:hypothetical protein ACLOJK_020770 [Asimina triloba]
MGDLPLDSAGDGHRRIDLSPPNSSPLQPSPFEAQKLEAGSLFVLKSRGSWIHCGYHLTSAIVGPALLSLPFAFANLGWVAGVALLVLGAIVTFYSFTLLSVVLEYHEQHGRRQLRFKDMATDILGPKWGSYYVGPLQLAICYGGVVGLIILAGQSMKLYSTLNEALMNSIRIYTNLSFVLVFTGISSKAPPKDYSLASKGSDKFFGVFNAFSLIATAYGNGILPEIQATLAPPIKGKMFKGLCMCYVVITSTFFSVAISGYWAFGNLSQGNILSNFNPDGKRLVPDWFTVLTNIFMLLQLTAVSVLYLQPTNVVLENWLADVKNKQFSIRNVVPRLVSRSLSVILGTAIAAMLPFFADINAFLGAFGIIPLNFVLPMIFYNQTFKPSKSSILFWGNTISALAFTLTGLIGTVCAIRQIVLDAKSYHLFANA